MRHQMKIFIGGEPPNPIDSIFECRRLPMREKILRFLFGAQRKVTIIVPGRSVDMVEIKEVQEHE